MSLNHLLQHNWQNNNIFYISTGS